MRHKEQVTCQLFSDCFHAPEGNVMELFVIVRRKVQRRVKRLPVRLHLLRCCKSGLGVSHVLEVFSPIPLTHTRCTSSTRSILRWQPHRDDEIRLPSSYGFLLDLILGACTFWLMGMFGGGRRSPCLRQSRYSCRIEAKKGSHIHPRLPSFTSVHELISSGGIGTFSPLQALQWPHFPPVAGSSNSAGKHLTSALIGTLCLSRPP